MNLCDYFCEIIFSSNSVYQKIHENRCESNGTSAKMYWKQTKPCYISIVANKVGNLGLKIDMQYARQAKLGKMKREPPKLESKWVFLIRKAEMLSNNSKISNWPILTA